MKKVLANLKIIINDNFSCELPKILSVVHANTTL